MASAEESSSSTSNLQQQEELDPIMHLAQDMFHKTADYLNGEFDSSYLSQPICATVCLFISKNRFRVNSTHGQLDTRVQLTEVKKDIVSNCL